MSLIAEIKRRNVLRPVVLYAGAVWALAQGIAQLGPVFGANDALTRWFLLAATIGFPFWVAFTWFYELTPDGIKRDSDVVADASATRAASRTLDRWIIGVLAVAVVLLLTNTLIAPKSNAPAAATATPATSAAKPSNETVPADQSIAVLPFVNMSADKDNAYFSDGLAETLLDMLAQVSTLKVTARTSSFAFRDKAVDVREIGKQLGVAHVLEGSVQKSGDTVRITAQLIRASDGVHLWSKRYDRKLTDVFQIQDEIASEVVDSLKVVLAAEDRKRLTKTRTANVAAYDHYLQGRLQARDPSRARLLAAVAQYEQAIALDPGYAAAYSGIAEAWVLLEDYGGVPGADAFPHAEAAARRALELDPQSAEALTAMAMVRYRLHSDIAAASAGYEAALRANPSYAPAYNLYADLLRNKGEYRRMLDIQKRAAELDPLSIYMKSRVANKLLQAGRLDEAGRVIDAMLADAPNNDYALEEAANLAANRGHLAQAVETYQRVHAARPGDPYSAARIATLATWMQDRPLAERALLAARARGAGNNWELRALAELADWQREPAQLDVLARQEGPPGAWWRAQRAMAQADLPQARIHLLEALRLRGYDAGRAPFATHISTLIELARVERALGLATWQATLQAADMGLEAVAGEGGVRVNVFDFAAYEQARVHALRGEREQALAQLRRAVAQGFARDWFLANDPVFAKWRADPEFTALVAGINARAAAEKAKLAGKVLVL